MCGLRYTYSFVLALLLPAASAAGKEFKVATPAEITSAMATAQPGDTLTMQSGTWSDARIVFQGSGTADNPVLLRAETYGSVVIAGASNLRIAGNYLVVSGLSFKNGYSPSGAVVEFRGSSSLESNYCRLTNSSIEDFNPSNDSTDYKWVSLYGTHNRCDHCSFKGKTHIGTTVVVWLSATPNYHRIDHNYFGPRPALGQNGGETIRVGTSDWSMYDSFTTVEENVFEQCNGEIEIISNKSCGNVYRYNTFLNCQGTLTLRHGNRCRVEGNFFFGSGLSQSGGIRVIGEDHVIVNNYVSGTTGTGLRAALSLMDGIQNSPLNGYFQVKRALVLFNTLVDNTSTIDVGAGKDSDNILPPLDCTVANNVIFSSAGPLIKYTDTPVNLLWEGNVAYGASLGISPVPTGITVADPALALAGSDGLRRPSAGSILVDSAKGSYSDVTTDMDGQARGSLQDVGADEVSADPLLHLPLKPADVGPGTGTTGAESGGAADRPGRSSLDQNYPNPFNPHTRIGWEIGEGGWVRLLVYDMLGREVATIVNERRASGRYSSTFDAQCLPSGVYLYRLLAGRMTESRPMMVVK